MRKLCSLLVVVLGSAPADAQVKLEWQFKPGDNFFAERVYTQNQTVAIKGKTFKEQRTKTWLTAFTFKEKTVAGYVLDLKVESVRFSNALSPSKEGAEEKSATHDDLDNKLAAKIKGCVFTITVTPQGKVVKFDGYDGFIQKLADKNSDTERLMKTVLAQEVIRADVEDLFYFLPKTAVRKGDKWRRETLESAPPFGSFQSACEYVLEDEKGPELAIGYTIKMAFKPTIESGDLFRVSKGSLKTGEGKGSIVFDVQLGRLIRNEKSMLVRGELTIEAAGVQSKMEFSSENTLRARLLSPHKEKRD